MNLPSLFNAIRSLYGKLSQVQVDSVNAILNSCSKHGIIDNRQIAYILATAYHESGLKPIIEDGKGAGLPYGQKLDIGGGPGHRVPYTQPDQIYYGRGFVQLTWKSNYADFGKLLGIDLVNNPDLALNTTYAAEILVIGMVRGMFTGHTLNMFFNNKLTDAVDARTIVNGHDCAILISTYYNKIYAGMTAPQNE